MQIEVGSWFLTRGGQRVFIQDFNSESLKKFTGELEDGTQVDYYRTGKYSARSEHDYDIVKRSRKVRTESVTTPTGSVSTSFEELGVTGTVGERSFTFTFRGPSRVVREAYADTLNRILQ